MVDIVGKTATGFTIFIACAFVSDEREPTYQWVLERLRDILKKNQIPHPLTIFSDDADSLLAAIATVFPGTTALLCVWHIQKTIEKSLKPMMAQHLLVYQEKEGDIREETLERGSYAKDLFNKVIFAPTVANVETRLESF